MRADEILGQPGIVDGDAIAERRDQGAQLPAEIAKSDYADRAEIKPGAWFILGGQKAYVAEMGETFTTPQGRTPGCA